VTEPPEFSTRKACGESMGFTQGALFYHWT